MSFMLILKYHWSASLAFTDGRMNNGNPSSILTVRLKALKSELITTYPRAKSCSSLHHSENTEPEDEAEQESQRLRSRLSQWRLCLKKILKSANKPKITYKALVEGLAESV